jgi:hypothetical protein
MVLEPSLFLSPEFLLSNRWPVSFSARRLLYHLVPPYPVPMMVKRRVMVDSSFVSLDAPRTRDLRSVA